MKRPGWYYALWIGLTLLAAFSLGPIALFIVLVAYPVVYKFLSHYV